MRAGAEVIYQATFLRDGLRGHADFLFRVDRPSDLGDWSYEVADTKLARRAKPYFILQLCFYSELARRASRASSPSRSTSSSATASSTASASPSSPPTSAGSATRFLAELAAGVADTYPEPVAHCSICRWRDRLRRATRSPTTTSAWSPTSPGASASLLRGAGVTTLAALGSAEGLAVDGHRPERARSASTRRPRCSSRARETGEHDYRAARRRRRAAASPASREPSAGDVFFDMEGDPFFDEAGSSTCSASSPSDGGEPEFTAFWGRDRAEEKRAFEQFIDFVTERRERFPDLHVYHYAHYEVTALKRLAGAHGTREEEVDQLLRDEVFVDLYKVVREALRISQPSYSIKKVEAFYMDERETAVTDGGDSIDRVRALARGRRRRQAILDAIADYNHDDCVSTLQLRDWLLELRAEAERRVRDREAELVQLVRAEPQERSEEALAIREETEALIAALLEGVPEDPAERDDDQRARWLMAQLLEYHRREARPVWWASSTASTPSPTTLIEDADAIARLAPDADTPPRQEKKSLVHRCTFPPQETKLGPGSTVCRPGRRRQAGRDRRDRRRARAGSS